MDVRGITVIGVIYHPVDKLHNDAVGFGIFVIYFEFFFICAHLADDIAYGSVSLPCLVKMVYIFDYVFIEGDIVIHIPCIEEVFYHITFNDIVGIIYDDPDLSILFFEGNPEFTAQIFLLEVFYQFEGYRLFVTELDKVAIVKFFHGIADSLL